MTVTMTTNDDADDRNVALSLVVSCRLRIELITELTLSHRSLCYSSLSSPLSQVGLVRH